MGYTHYWTPSKNKIPKAALSVLRLVLLHGMENNVLEVEGDQKVQFDENKIWFNGIGTYMHETFAYEVGGEWSFCKTARKPYDLYVCATLLILGYYLPDLEFSSDGGVEDDEWGKAIAFLLDKKDEYKLDQNLIDSLFRIRDGEDGDLFEDYPLYLPDSEDDPADITNDLPTFLEIALRAFDFTPVAVKEDLDISDEEFDRLHKKLKAYMGEGS